MGDASVKAGPVVGFQGGRTRLNAYTETGAAGGNIAVPRHTLQSARLVFGGEMFAASPMGDNVIIPYARVTYNVELKNDPRTITLGLASAQNAMGSASIVVPAFNDDYVEAGLGVQGTAGNVGWHLGYTARVTMDERTSHGVQLGVSLAF